MTALFHRRFEAKNGFESIQAGFAVGQEAAQRMPLYESPAPASNQVRQGRRALEPVLEKPGPFVRDGDEAEHSIVIGYRLPQRDHAPMQARGPDATPAQRAAAGRGRRAP